MHGSKHHTSAVITQTIKAIALLLNHTKGKKKFYKKKSTHFTGTWVNLSSIQKPEKHERRSRANYAWHSKEHAASMHDLLKARPRSMAIRLLHGESSTSTAKRPSSQQRSEKRFTLH